MTRNFVTIKEEEIEEIRNLFIRENFEFGTKLEVLIKTTDTEIFDTIFGKSNWAIEG